LTLFNSLSELTPAAFGSAVPRAFVPPADLIVSDEALTVTMDVPGLDAETLEIELMGETLTVRGERRHPQLSRERTQWYRLERAFGKFQRVLQVPKGVDPGALAASIADGILTIHVPLPEARRPHRIEITNTDQHRTIPAEPNWDQLESQVTDQSQVTDSSPDQEPALAGAPS
jgi:HSP20 family protein